MTKVYKLLNESVNYNIELDEGIFSWLGRNLVARPVKWAGRKLTNRARRKFSRSDPNDFNIVKGGYFTSDSDLDSLNKRIIDSELGKYIEKDPNGKVRFNSARLKVLKTKDPELYNQILNLSKSIAQNNNKSWVYLSSKRKNAIINALNDLEQDTIQRGIIDHPLSDDVLSLVSKVDPDLVRKYNTIANSYQNLSKNGSFSVAGNRDEMLKKQKEALKTISAKVLDLDTDIRNHKSKYKPKIQDRTSDVNIAINRKIRQNIPQKASVANFDYSRKLK